MRWLTSLRSVWRTLFRSARLDRDLDDELREYVSALEDRHREAGLPPAEARRTALVEFEGLEQTKEKVRDARIGAAVESVLQDLRFALRGLRRNPAFAATAILTLALGIGATVAVFSIVSAVLLRPLPYADPDRLVFVWDQRDGQPAAMSPGRLIDVRRRATVLSGIAGFSEIPVNLLGGDHAEAVTAATVSTGFFEVLGVQPLLGRTFDVGRENQRAVVLSYGLWQRRFGGDPSMVGREIPLDAGGHTVIGVMPRDFSWLPRGGAGSPTPEVWIPAPLGEVPAVPAGSPVERLTESRDLYYLVSVARMKPGLGLPQVNAGLAVLARELAEQYSATDQKRGLRAIPALQQVAGDARTPLLLLLGAVGLVLAVACANVANLLLGRTLARRGEVAVRLAIGAGRARLARQFLVEALVLAGVATGLGALLAHAALASLIRLVPTDIPRLGEARVDGTVLAAAILIAIGTAAVLALVQVMDVRRVPASMHEASRRTSGRRRGGRAVLLVAEVAAAVTLVIGAGLLIRSLAALQRVDTGISRPDQLLTFNLAVGGGPASTPARIAQFYQEVLDRIRNLPQVRSAGAALALPMSGEDYNTTIYIEGRPDPAPGEVSRVGFQPVTPGYLGTLGLRLLAGRDIGVSDGRDAPKVTVVNETFARRFWGQQSPLGRRLRLSDNATAAMRTVVGVVQDVRHRGPAEPARAELFLPAAQVPFPSMAFVIRTEGDPMLMVRAVRAAVAAVDATQPLADVQTVAAYVQRSTARTRFLGGLLAGFGGVALLLAAIGIYGVLSWSVVERRREIGVRMAAGATPGGVAGMVLREGGTQLGVGLAIGTAAAAALGHLLAGLLFGVRPADPVTYTSTLVILALVGAAALWLPAYRASRVDPATVLRE
jgi:putative ABC transport system permease protein